MGTDVMNLKSIKRLSYTNVNNRLQAIIERSLYILQRIKDPLKWKS